MYQKNKYKQTKVRVLKRILLVVLSVLLLLSSFSAAVFAEEMGFVEYQTEASINFNEVIIITLVEKETGYFYEHELHRINNYTGNMSIPFGTYTMNARVVSTTGEDVSQYFVSFPSEELVIQNETVAVPIVLKVENLTGIDTSPNDYANATDKADTTKPSSSTVPVPSDSSSKADDLIDENQEHKETKAFSFWISTLFYFGLMIIVLVVWYLVKRKQSL